MKPCSLEIDAITGDSVGATPETRLLFHGRYYSFVVCNQRAIPCVSHYFYVVD